MRLKGISDQGFQRLARAIFSFSHKELQSTGKINKGVPDFGPYELTSKSSGTPEGGNFEGGIIFGNGLEVEIPSWGGLDEYVYFDEDEEEGLSPEQIESLYTALIQATGIKSLISQGKSQEEAEDIMNNFWSLEGTDEGLWVMKNKEMILEE